MLMNTILVNPPQKLRRQLLLLLLDKWENGPVQGQVLRADKQHLMGKSSGSG